MISPETLAIALKSAAAGEISFAVSGDGAARWTDADRAGVFFDDTQIEVFGPSFEGAKMK